MARAKYDEVNAFNVQRPDSRILPFREPLQPAVVFLSCPIRASLEILGRKWTMLILYTMGFMEVNRFNEMHAYLPEITRSLLAKRLAQLEEAGFVTRKRQEYSSTRGVIWELTEKGEDTIPILMRLIAHSSKWRAAELFENKASKSLQQVFPQKTASKYLEVSTEPPDA